MPAGSLARVAGHTIAGRRRLREGTFHRDRCHRGRVDRIRSELHGAIESLKSHDRPTITGIAKELTRVTRSYRLNLNDSTMPRAPCSVAPAGASTPEGASA